MESKEALNEIKNYTLVSYDENGEEDDCTTFGELEPNLIEPIEKDLDRLEKYDKAIEILKPFLKDRICKEESGIEWCGFKEEPYSFYLIDGNDPLKKEQYELLKEVFE